MASVYILGLSMSINHPSHSDRAQSDLNITSVAFITYVHVNVARSRDILLTDPTAGHIVSLFDSHCLASPAAVPYGDHVIVSAEVLLTGKRKAALTKKQLHQSAGY